MKRKKVTRAYKMGKQQATEGLHYSNPFPSNTTWYADFKRGYTENTGARRI